MGRIEWTHEDEAGVETVHVLPARWEICGTCDGHGKHSHAIGAITSDEWHGPDWDDESRDTYMRGGYDQTCETCGGLGRVEVVDLDRMPKALRGAYEAHLEQQATWAAQERREREMGY